MYTTERVTATAKMDDYIEGYVNIEEFLECCKVCPNYGVKWSCPPYDFDAANYWKEYREIRLLGTKIMFDSKLREKVYTEEELERFLEKTLYAEKQKLSAELFEEEKKYPGSISLSAGSCNLCGEVGCAKERCRHYDKMRYSIESLGGNVGKTCSKLLGVELQWVEQGKLPEHFVLVCGLLVK